jgi:hypothetical protein
MSVLHWSDVRQLRRKLIYSSACGLYNANNVKAGVEANIGWCLNSWDPLLFCELEDSDLKPHSSYGLANQLCIPVFGPVNLFSCLL